ncbi:MAG: hypothetical protein B6D72_14570 [gamma proteobacterium symbiont of Ctena orbiculata]|uniref:Uncharacterized protein n=1 Tax=Candidatus Thiodiazotropha taylori TaxID=2792791 RepID=A0A944QT90_9GAMM|nr:hypothetical protein [Candidatus Thiodiazotropha taylori]PUB84724.1 MAG: hypothetical protein DBP00_14110 [gamma proteobacterium symbiont of Ctena orbiculata]MBT2988832.1 hypothetical protein [Candidatus Thiodiazotropha taylori]MBT2998315.1 hypothetical protein [Candidatus Thiodiazotropha taylori]MBT3002574.1 hypothetical protein [Candidatus Thiodiazotropha taylori]
MKDAWQPRQNRWLGRLSTIIGFTLFVSSIIPAMIAQEYGEGDYLLILLCLGMFGGGAMLVVYGKRHLTPRVEEVLANDHRAPILYLRSFNDQADDFTLGGFFSAVGAMFGNRNMGLSTSSWGPTFQSQLAYVMERVGPYIAVGRPGVRLPGTGAARLYVPDEQWQQRVTQLIRSARLVIIRAGTSAGLNWEIETVRRIISKPHQLLVILPLSKKGYRAFRQSVAEAGIKLPERPPNAMFMTFDERWEPLFLETTGKLEHTLSPYFRMNNIEPPEVSGWDAFRLFFR